MYYKEYIGGADKCKVLQTDDESLCEASDYGQGTCTCTVSLKAKLRQ